jgi:hypothetical protein
MLSSLSAVEALRANSEIHGAGRTSHPGNPVNLPLADEVGHERRPVNRRDRVRGDRDQTAHAGDKNGRDQKAKRVLSVLAPESLAGERSPGYRAALLGVGGGECIASGAARKR